MPMTKKRVMALKRIGSVIADCLRAVITGRCQRYEPDPGLVDEIRGVTKGNYAVGDVRFAQQITAALGRRAMPSKSGRPHKMAGPETGDLFGVGG